MFAVYCETATHYYGDVWAIRLTDYAPAMMIGSTGRNYTGNYVAGPTAMPACRDFVNVAPSPYSNYLYIYGGSTANSTGYYSLGDIWRLDLATYSWTWYLALLAFVFFLF